MFQGILSAGGGGSGGGIDNTGTMTLAGSTLSGNSAGINFNFPWIPFTGNDGNGGGIDNTGTLAITDCTLSDNSTIFDAGYGGGGKGGNGGGIENEGTLTLTNSTLVDNAAWGNGGGGIDNTGTLTLTDCTLSRNTSTTSGLPIVGNGGGIENDTTGTLTVTDCTLADNDAANKGGGIINAGILTVAMSLFANPDGGNLVLESNAEFASQGHNLFSDTPAVKLAPTDLINTNPLLAPLGNYGGSTETMALLPGSPAIDAGITVAGVTTDQRGVARPQGTAPDIGAFELRGFSIAVTGGDGQSTQINTAFAALLSFAVTSPYGEPVAGGQITVAVPATGPSAILASKTVILDANGLGSVAATANDVGGSYSITIGASGAGSIDLNLTNIGLPPVVLSLGASAFTSSRRTSS